MNPVSKFVIIIIEFFFFFFFLFLFPLDKTSFEKTSPFRIKAAVTVLRKIAGPVPCDSFKEDS